MSAIEERLNALGITLPTPVAPIANYAPFIRTGNLLFISGQVSVDESGGINGIVGDDVDEAGGRTFVRHVHHAQTRTLVEQRRCQMQRVTDAGRAICQFRAGLFGVVDQLAHAFGGR